MPLESRIPRTAFGPDSWSSKLFAVLGCCLDVAAAVSQHVGGQVDVLVMQLPGCFEVGTNPNEEYLASDAETPH